MKPTIASYDFSPYRTVVDVGGSGSLLIELLQAYPECRGVLLELDSMLPTASSTIAAAGLADRIELVAGDFFAAVPAGDAYLVKSNLHNFGDDQALELLRVVRCGNAPVFVIETMIPAGNDPHYSKFDDIEMMAIAGGNDRTEREWSELVTAAGFAVRAVLPADERFSMSVADPV
ncbi:hypothetical protein GCM10029976_042910 [Kribbella albertanoniae]|uniref:O-methyltransferase C-terminal domain-containing protein n=1 Tax=Kribbella albertanoniae TaxID=1266829 RepID=A0A4R4Q6W2_9ACTN|nr:methyltransferase [Kribbella albertanoniae]TDC30981.1 hypothetical protein E1261_12030 [Kribbella albertanoniae]